MAEEVLPDIETRQAFLLKLSDALRPVGDAIEIQAVAVRLLGEHLGVDRAYYVEVDEASGVARVGREYLRGGSPSLAGEHRVSDFGWVIPPMRTGRVLIVDDVTRSDLVPEAERPAMAAVRIAAHVNAPLVKGGALVGALCVTEPVPRAWTAAEVDLVRETGDRIWAAVERARAEADLRVSEGRLRAVAANLPNAAVFVVDANLRYVLVEGQALRAAGFKPPDLEGKAVAEAMGEALAAEYVPNYRRALAGEEFAVEHSSHGRHYATHLAPLPGPDGRMAAAMAVSYDITDRVRAEEEVRRANDRLEARVAERTAVLREEVEHRKDLTRRLGTAQEDERRRVSRDLHDSVGQLLAALPIAIRAVEVAGDLPAPVAGKLAEVRRLVDAVSREVHALAVQLRPTALDDLGIEEALELLVSEWSARSGVRADFQAVGIGPGRLPWEVETAIYRVVQEALANVAKHARAESVSVVVSRPDGSVTAVIEDDGAGFAPDAVPRGRLGLMGMRERTALVGGELVVESRPDGGTTVHMRIPVPRSAEV